MPKLYEYLGIIIFFYSNEHEPVHVHARKGEYESKAELIIKNGVINEIIITDVKGFKPLKGKDLKDFKKFMEIYSNDIIEKWIDYFVYNKDIVFESITRRLL